MQVDPSADRPRTLAIRAHVGWVANPHDDDVSQVTGGERPCITREGLQSPVLQKFGFAERKVGKPTPATRASAVVKGQETRAARGTKGKKQKAAIHGATAETKGVTPPQTTAQGTVATKS